MFKINEISKLSKLILNISNIRQYINDLTTDLKKYNQKYEKDYNNIREFKNSEHMKKEGAVLFIEKSEEELNDLYITRKNTEELIKLRKNDYNNLLNSINNILKDSNLEYNENLNNIQLKKGE